MEIGCPDRAEFIQGTVSPIGLMTLAGQDEAGPMLGEADLRLPVVIVDEPCLRKAPGLSRLFELHRAIGSVALHEQTYGETGWALWADPARPADTLVKLKLRLTAPHRVHADLLLTAQDFVDQLLIAATSETFGLITEAELNNFTTDPPANVAEGMERCVLLTAPPSTVLPHLSMIFGR